VRTLYSSVPRPAGAPLGCLEEAAVLQMLMSTVAEPCFSLTFYTLDSDFSNLKKKKLTRKTIAGGWFLSVSLPVLEEWLGWNAASVGFFCLENKSYTNILYTNDFFNKHTF